MTEPLALELPHPLDAIAKHWRQVIVLACYPLALDLAPLLGLFCLFFLQRGVAVGPAPAMGPASAAPPEGNKTTTGPAAPTAPPREDPSLARPQVPPLAAATASEGNASAEGPESGAERNGSAENPLTGPEAQASSSDGREADDGEGKAEPAIAKPKRPRKKRQRRGRKTLGHDPADPFTLNRTPDLKVPTRPARKRGRYNGAIPMPPSGLSEEEMQAFREAFVRQEREDAERSAA